MFHFEGGDMEALAAGRFLGHWQFWFCHVIRQVLWSSRTTVASQTVAAVMPSVSKAPWVRLGEIWLLRLQLLQIALLVAHFFT